jgi:hypothetical protein
MADPPLYSVRVIMKNTTTEQMELGMRNQIRNNYRNVRPDRLKRARWWFTQMRRVVDLALPPQAMASPRPEQTYLRLK